MRKFLLMLLILGLTGPLWGETSKSTQLTRARSYIKRAGRYLDNIEKRMAAKPQAPPAMIQSWEKKAEKTEQALQKAQELLSEAGGGAAESQQIASSRQRLQTVRQSIAQRSKGVTAATQLASGPEGQKAVEDYRNLTKRLREVSGWLRGPKDAPLMNEAYQEAMEARRALDEKYAPVLGMRTRETFDLTAAANEAKMTEQSIESTIQWAKQNFPLSIKKDLELAESHAQDLQKNRAFGGWETSVQRYLDQSRLRVEKLRSVAPGDPAVEQMSKMVSASENRMEATKKRFRAKMIASNKMPADLYRAGDAGAIKSRVRQLWAQKYPSDQVLDVVIADSTWSDFAGTRWVGSSRSWQDYNFDRLNAYVKVAGGGSYNYKFFAQVVRQNLQGGKIDIFPDRPADPGSHVHTLLPK